MNKLCVFICLVATFTGGSHLGAQIITSSVDLTATGVTIVDSSSASQFINISDPENRLIDEVLFAVNISSSSSAINSDGTTILTGGSPFNNELVLTLISPSGTSLELIGANTFALGDDEDAVELLDINFADGGASQGVNPTGGTFAPTGGSFSIFDGELASGAWEVVIQDTTGADPKSLNGFSLSVGVVPEPSSAFFMMLSLIGVTTLRRKTDGC